MRLAYGILQKRFSVEWLGGHPEGLYAASFEGVSCAYRAPVRPAVVAAAN